MVNRSWIRTGLAIIAILGSLLFGLLIYIESREPDLWLHRILHALGLPDRADDTRIITFDSYPLWLINSLPNALWMFALTLTILTAWNFNLNRNSVIWVSIGLVFGLTLEFLQLTHFWQGAFDWMDIVFIALGGVLAVSLFGTKHSVQ